MQLKKVIWITFILLVLGMSLGSSIRICKAEPETIVVPDDYSTIQEAINAANEGDTIFVKSGTYYENVVVNKSLSLIGENRSETIINGNMTGDVIWIYANYVNISTFTITNGSYGIYMTHNSSTIENNIISFGNKSGIYIHGLPYHSSGNTIINNTIVENSDYTDTNLGHGIVLLESCDNRIVGNFISNNSEYGIFMYTHSHGTNMTGNVVVDNEEGGILLEFCENSTLKNNNMSGNHFNFGVYGHKLQEFISNDIDTSNIVEGNPIYYWINEHNRSVPVDAGFIAVINCTNITIENHTFRNNFQGVTLAGTNDSCIIGNTITECEWNIQLRTSFNNNITSNTIANTTRNQKCMGIYTRNSSDNNIYSNNFFNNSVHVESYYSNNTWDNGYPLGGNYWDNHKLVDGYTGSYQNQTGKDGICDTPKVINGTDQDDYPLLGSATADLAIQTFTLAEEEIEDVEVWIDGDEPTYYSLANTTVSQGVHSVKVRSPFYRGGRRYTFQYWNDSSYDNPRNVTVLGDTTLIAYYANTSSSGCPFVSVWNGTDFVVDNNLLPNSAKSNGTEVEDYYRLEQSLVPSYEGDHYSLYSLRLSEFQQEHSYLDQAQLIAVDHNSDINVAVSPFGEILTYEDPYTPFSAVDDQGIDRIGLIREIDDFYYEGYNGGYLLLNFSLVEGEMAKLIMRADPPPQKQSIHIQVLDAGNWTDVVEIIPRTYWATEIVDLSSYLPNSTEEFNVRLYFTDYHRVDFVGLDTTAQAEIDVKQALLLTAYHSEDGLVTSKLRTDNDIYAELTPGQQITLLFAASTQSGEQRTFIIYVKGYYMTIDN